MMTSGINTIPQDNSDLEDDNSALTLRLHVKILEKPDDDVSVPKALKNMQDVYAAANIKVELITTEELNLPLLKDVYIGDCAGSETTPQQRELFSHRNGVEDGDVVAYYVRATSKKKLNGCATHPRQRPGAIITKSASPWTLAHEFGHVLGIHHVDSSNRLMYGGSTDKITNPPPDLVASEIATIRRSVRNLLNQGDIEQGDKDMSDESEIADDVIEFLSSEEPDYDKARDKFLSRSKDVTKVIETFLGGKNIGLIEKGIYFLSILDDDPGFLGIAREAIKHDDPRVRGAVADALNNVAVVDEDVLPIYLTLFEDSDVGVRKLSLLATPMGDRADSVPSDVNDQLLAKIKQMRDSDPEPGIREIAAEVSRSFER